MGEDSVARRYAGALFAQSLKTNSITAIERDLNVVGEGMSTIPSLRVLTQPLMAEDRKKLLFKKAFGDEVQPATLNFMYLLTDKRRLDLIEAVRTEFVNLARAHRNEALATATSATPLTDAQVAALKQALEARTGKHIRLETETDATLIGGVLVRIGDTVYDGTVRGGLDRLREQLLARK